MTEDNSDPDPSTLAVDAALRNALRHLGEAGRLMVTGSERTAQVVGRQFDTAYQAIETLLELRAGDLARRTAKLPRLTPPAQAADPNQP